MSIVARVCVCVCAQVQQQVCLLPLHSGHVHGGLHPGSGRSSWRKHSVRLPNRRVCSRRLQLPLQQGVCWTETVHTSTLIFLTCCDDVPAHGSQECFIRDVLVFQGETFDVPEVVPFRLTQNMVHAMGPMGTEGLFRQACEVTLRLMRDQREPLMRFKHTHTRAHIPITLFFW